MNRELVDSGIEWIGKIPEDWNIVKVNKVFFRRKEINKEIDPVILSLARSGVKVRDITTNEGQLAEDYSSYHRVHIGDLMINPMDLISGANCSVSEVEGVISPAYINLAKKEICNSKYYDYFFKNQYWVNAMFIHGKGVSFDNRWTMNAETMMNYKIPFPSIKEQNKIVNYLDKQCSRIYNIMEGNKKEIELLEESKVSYITDNILSPNYISKCCTNYNWIYKLDKNGIPMKLKFLAKSRTGTTPDNFQKDELSEKIDWYTPVDFINFKLKKSERNLDSDLILDDKLFPKLSTLIIGIGGTLGKIGYIQNKAYSNQQITAVIPNEKIFPKYLTYNLISAMKYIKDTCPYTTMPILSNGYLNNIFICYRNLREQENICDKIDAYLRKIDKVIEYRKQIIEKLEEYKKSLIYEVVTGKKEV